MKGQREELIKYRLMRAKETLEDAEILFDNDRWFSTVNRVYYAMFYAVNGLLLTKDLNSSKHSGVLSLFNKEFVNKGIVDKELGRFYNEMFEFRQKADYKDLVKFEGRDVKLWIKKGVSFVGKINDLAESLMEEK